MHPPPTQSGGVKMGVALADYFWQFATAVWATLGEMAPFLLFGFLMAGVLSVLISPETIERLLGGKGLGAIVKASLFGVPLPLCSCGVIPVAASLRRHGATRGATTAFLISTPQTGVDSIFVTFSLLGWVFAIFRPIVALASGIIGGGVVQCIKPTNASEAKQEETCREVCCAPGAGQGIGSRILQYGFVSLPREIAGALVIGLLIAGAIAAVVPEDYFANYLGGGIGAMLIMMLLGIPIYICSTASVPIAAAMIVAGVSPGAALVFLMTGPATNAATIGTIWQVMGHRTAGAYLLTVAMTSLLAGLTLDYIFTAGKISAEPAMPWMLPDVVKAAAAVLLLTVLGIAVIRGKKKVKEGAP